MFLGRGVGATVLKGADEGPGCNAQWYMCYRRRCINSKLSQLKHEHERRYAGIVGAPVFNQMLGDIRDVCSSPQKSIDPGSSRALHRRGESLLRQTGERPQERLVRWELLGRNTCIQLVQDAMARSTERDDDEVADDKHGLAETVAELKVHNDRVEDADKQRGDPSFLCQYDRGHDLSWLAQLEPQTVKIL